MCIEVIVDGKLVSSIGEMKEVIGCDPPIADEMPEGFIVKDDLCLCCVDLEACANHIGATLDWDDHGDLHFIRCAT